MEDVLCEDNNNNDDGNDGEVIIRNLCGSVLEGIRVARMTTILVK